MRCASSTPDPMRVAVAILAVAAAAALAAPVASAQRIAPPNPHPVTRDGPSGRYMLDDPWLLRVDPRDRGAGQHRERRRSTAGWSPITVPNACTSYDRTRSGFVGAPRCYRRDFRFP